MRRWKVTALTVCVCGMGGLLPAYLWAKGGQTQAEMDVAAAKDYQKADAELNRVYRRLAASLEPPIKRKLKAAESAWIKFRDAESAFRASTVEGGSAYPALYASDMADLTRQRIQDLNAAYKLFNSR